MHKGRHNAVATRHRTMTHPEKPTEWGKELPALLGDEATRRHEQVLWGCAQRISAAVESQPWVALIGGTALRHVTLLRRASLDLDFVVAGPGWQAGEWVEHVLKQTPGVRAGSVVVTKRSTLQTDMRYVCDITGEPKWLKVDKLDSTKRGVEWAVDAVTYEGVRTLRPERLAELKMQTLVGDEPRLKARDIYDGTHILRRYECGLTRAQAEKLGAIADLLFEREQEWRARFDEDEVLNRKAFEPVRSAFTKTAKWRERLVKGGEQFEPVGDGGSRSIVVVGGSGVRLVDNRPTHEGETLGMARSADEAAGMLIEAGIAPADQEKELVQEIEHGMAQARARGLE